MSDGLTVRRAVVADAEAISGVNSRAWLHAYFDIVEPRRMFKRMEDVTQTQQWATRLASPVGEIWCAEVGGVVAGYVAVGPSEDADGNPGTGALWSLDLDPSAQGAGLGSRLHDHALVPVAAAEPFFEWADDFIIKGNNGQKYEKSGSIDFLTLDLKTVLATLTFSNLGIFRCAPEKAEAGVESIRRVKAEMYCESMTFSMPAP